MLVNRVLKKKYDNKKKILYTKGVKGSEEEDR